MRKRTLILLFASADVSLCDSDLGCETCNTDGPDVFDCEDDDSLCDYLDCYDCISGVCEDRCEGTSSPLCDTVNDQCVECLDDDDCTEECAPTCNISTGMCEDDDDLCTEECDVCSSGSCVADDGECSEGDVCDESDFTCKTGCTSDADCTEECAPTCNISTGMCEDDDDLCTGECDVCSSGNCVDDDDLCTGECDICSSGSCVADDGECSEGEVCDESDFTCKTGCTSDADCTEECAPTCNISTGMCEDDDDLCTGECDVCSSGSCVDSEALCTGECDICSSGSCVDSEALCTGECDICSSGSCVDSEALCTGECDVCSSGSCVDDDGLCTEPCTICNSGSCEDDCDAAELCYEPTEECVQCLDDGDCETHFTCNLTSHACECTDDEEWGVGDPITAPTIDAPASGAVVAVGATVSLSCSGATDTDSHSYCSDNEWVTEYPSDGISYTWTAVWAGTTTPAGTFSDNDGPEGSWVAPNTGGEVTISVEADDEGAHGSDNDGTESTSVTITVVEVDLMAYKRDSSTQVSADNEEDPGAYVAYNNDDDDADGGGTTADRDDTNGVGDEDDLIKVYFGFSNIFDTLQTGKVVIERADTKIRLWKQQGKGSGQEITFGADGDPPNKKIYDLSDAGDRTDFLADIKYQYLWVEGYSPSTGLKDTELKLIYTDSEDQQIHADTVKLTVFETELKTYKRGGVELKMDKEKDPGNYILYNSDDDNGNNTKDFEVSDSPVDDENDLQKVHFKFGSIFTGLQTGKVVIVRSSSKLKLWKETSKTTEIVFYGNEKTYDLSESGDRTDFASDIQDKDRYIEGADKSASMLDSELTLKYLDSDDADICKDPVKYTIFKIELDVNHDGDTDDAVDEVVGYLPGEMGSSKEISGTGVQEMKIVIEPVDGTAINAVALTAENVTSEIGFCMNAGTQPNTAHDYSFSESSNSTSASASISGGKATQPFWCKDYGAFCNLKTELKKGSDVVLTWTRPIPVDTHSNRIANCWPDEDYVNTDEDWDVENLPNSSGTDGDGLTRYEEYRGFMMKGIHNRTQARRKDLFIYHEFTGYGAADLSIIADIHFVTADEMNGAYHDNENSGNGSVRSTVGPRIVNFNYDTYAHSVEQHGLWIAVMTASNDGNIGNWGVCKDNNGIGGVGAAAIGSPETAGRVEIYAQNIDDAAGPVAGTQFSYDASSQEATLINDVIGHEGGHGLSVEHHANLANIAVTDYPGPWLDCNAKSSYTHDRSCEAGSTTCIIRYNYFDISAAVAGDLDKNGTPESATDSDWSPTMPACTGYCASCLSQVDINDN